MDQIAKAIVAAGMVVFTLGLFAVGIYLGYKSYVLFQAGQILEAMYMLMAASIFLRK